MTRMFALLYGAASYAVFFLTFLYAIGFVAGFGVPRHIDSGATSPWPVAVAIDLALLTLFALQHSVMARPGFKRWWTRFVPPVIERSTYVLLASLCLVALFAWWRPLPAMAWHVESEPLRWLLHAVSASGWLLVLTGTFLISHFELFGLRQVWMHARRQLPVEPSFVVRGYYRIVRHPLMLGFMLAFWSTPDMSQGHLLFAVVTSAYIVVAVKFLEERDLVAMHGETYRRYQRQVPMLLPLPQRRRSVAGGRAQHGHP